MLIDFENTGFINVHPSLCEEKNTYIPWGYIKGDISEQSDLMDLLANIESGLTAEQISLLVNADDRLTEVERDIAALETSHELDITHINTELNNKVNAVDVYTKSEIDSKKYLTEHQSLTGYATENWVYSKGYLSTETDPIWNAEKHKYALKSELPNMMGYARENWVSEQLTAKANLTDVYTKIEIDGKRYATESWTDEQLLAKANLTDIYTKTEIEGFNYASKSWTAEQLTTKADLTDVYTKVEIIGIGYATENWVEEQLTAKANLTDIYTKSEIDGFNYATESWTDEQLVAKANLIDVYTKIEIDGKNYASKDWTAEQLLAKANATDFYTKTEMLSVLEGYLTPDDLTGYVTESWVTSQGYLTEHQSLDNYYTKSEVETAISNVDVDLTGYATESYVDTAVKSKVDYSKIWTGTQDEWDTLSADEQNSYIIAMIEI